MSDQSNLIRAGYIAIVGRPNVGKSTLLNKIVGSKISITSANAQTTRGCVSGSYTGEDFAIKLIDTPGFINKSKHLLDRLLNKTVTGWIGSVDLVLFVVDARKWTIEDEQLLKHIQASESPILVVLNKVDLIKDKGRLLPRLQELTDKIQCKEIIPISATKGDNLDSLRASLLKYLPEDHPLESQILLTTPREIIIAERIREKIFRYMSAEIPRSSVAVVRKITSKKNVDHILASIIVERKSHRQMIIGKGGSKLKEIGTAARLELEELFNKKIYLEIFVEVEENWANNPNILNAYQIFYNQQY